jgi:hypothetical protein
MSSFIEDEHSLLKVQGLSVNLHNKVCLLKIVAKQCLQLFVGPQKGILKGKYHCTIDLLFDWFGLVCFANKNKNCQ